MSWLDGTTDSMDMNLSKLWEIVKDRGARTNKLKKYDKSQKECAERAVKCEKRLRKTFFYGRKSIYWGYKVAKSKGWQS